MNTVSPDLLISQLNWRYATKKFDAAKKIPAALWKTLEEALLLSPSSFGLQPWKFFVVTNPEIRQKLRAASWNQSQITDASHLVVFAVKKNFSTQDVEIFIQRIAEVRQVPVASLEGYKNIMLGYIASATPEKIQVWVARQVYIALGNFLTSAALLGIDACPMEGITPGEYDKILGVNAQGYETLFVATAGTRAVDDDYAKLQKVRHKAEEIIAHVE
jgi:nitroreductase